MAPWLGTFDIIALQETFDRDTTQTLARALLPTHPHQLLSLPRGLGKLNGGLTLLSRHPILSEQRVTYRDCQGWMSDCHAQRGALLVRIDTPQGALDLALTHLNSGATAAAHRARLRQLAQLHGALEAAGMAQGTRPLLLLGDLNVEGISPHVHTTTGALTPWGEAMQALGNDCVTCQGASCQGCDPWPQDLFWQAHAPWDLSEAGTQEANTYLCASSWNLGRCTDTSEPSWWRHRSRLDYALWWPGPPGTLIPQGIRHKSMPGQACRLPYLSDHRAVQIELRSP